MKTINKWKLFIGLISFISIIIGIILYFRNKDLLYSVDLSVIIKNNAFFNIMLISVIFFMSFIIIGSLGALLLYCYELISFSTVLSYIINHLKDFKLAQLTVFLSNKLLYILIILYITFLTLKMAKIIIKYHYDSKLLLFYIKRLFISSFFIILEQIINYLWLYKYV